MRVVGAAVALGNMDTGGGVVPEIMQGPFLSWGITNNICTVTIVIAAVTCSSTVPATRCRYGASNKCCVTVPHALSQQADGWSHAQEERVSAFSVPRAIHKAEVDGGACSEHTHYAAIN